MIAEAKLLVIGLAISVIGFSGIYAYNKIYDRGAASVQQKWDEVEAKRSEAVVALIMEKNQNEYELKAKAQKQQKASNEKINILNNTIATITSELHRRPDRPSVSDVPSNTAIRDGATGAELYRPDAEFLIREAARAEKVRIQLEVCTAQYNAVYETISKLQPK